LPKRREREERLKEDWEGPPGWHLEKLGEWLVNTGPWVNIGVAVVFLISRRPLRIAEPLSATFDMVNATYSITFQPWVSEKIVLRAYHVVAQLAYRAAYRLPRDKTIRVLRFVSGQADEKGRFPSWQVMHDRWNLTNPNDRFWNRSAYYKAYSRAVEALIPPYLPLGPE
jgi:hypothetical protein